MYNDIYDKEQFAYAFATLCKWIQLKIDGYGLYCALQKYNLNTVAIYGVSGLGGLVYSELRQSPVRITCFVDRRFADYSSGIDTIPVCDLHGIPDVDAVIVTPIYYFQEISCDLLNAGVPIKKIISLSMLMD